MAGSACHHGGEGQRGCVSLVPIFNHLAEDQMDEVMQVVQNRRLRKNETLYQAGDEADALYIVHRGQVKIYHLSESGKEQLIRVLYPGDFTGELALFQESEHESFAEAVVDSNICMIQRSDLQRFLMKYPTISLKILQEFSSRLGSSEKQTTQFATEKVELRIAQFLVENMRANKNDANQGRLELPMSKKDLASYLGTTPETLSRRLTDFEEAAYIQQTGQRDIEILDADGLLLS
ncbi:MAG TPA: Crp/Fnr family transcriptional regulator [Pseudogracilibacillus sp.]|nr:Crp/Fnr family transcriptional regulator [Pseudogracilibacillus sp.]